MPQPRATADLRAEEEKTKEEAARQQRAEEDARLEAELRLNEERLREEEAAMQRELEEEKERQKQMHLDEQQRREAKRREEDQRLLSFAKRSTSLEEPVPEKEELKHDRELVPKEEPEVESPEPEHNFLTPEQSPKEFQTNGSGSGSGERWEKRLGKFKYGNKRGELMNPIRSELNQTETETEPNPGQFLTSPKNMAAGKSLADREAHSKPNQANFQSTLSSIASSSSEAIPISPFFPPHLSVFPVCSLDCFMLFPLCFLHPPVNLHRSLSHLSSSLIRLPFL